MTNDLDSLGRVRAQAVVFLVAAFVVGALFGAAIDTLVRARAHPPGAPPGMRDGLPPFLHDLDLSDAQRDAIRGILRRGRPRMDAIIRDAQPRLRAVTDSVRAEIRATLTDAQRARFDSIVPPGTPMGPGPGGPPVGRPRPGMPGGPPWDRPPGGPPPPPPPGG